MHLRYKVITYKIGSAHKRTDIEAPLDSFICYLILLFALYFLKSS